MVDGTAADAATAELDGTWARDVRWWDVAFYVIVVLSALALLAAGVSGRALLVSLAAVATILVTYLAWGRRAARTRDQVPAHVYLVVAIACTLVVVGQDALGTLLLFAVFTQIWMLSEHLWAQVVLCVALAAGTALALAFDPQTGRVEPEELASAAPQMGVALAFALSLGLWTAHTLRQSERHARLVDELRATQAELGRASHEAGVLAERERVAQEIHDTLAQGFTSVVMLAQAASADLDRDATDAARERLALVESTARDNLAEARALVAASAPAPLQGSTLGEALRRLVDRFADETGTRVELAAPESPRLSSAEDVVLLRSAQEALTNVRRHADATAVRVELRQDADGTVLEVTDDGRGLPVDASGFTEGYGLRGMRERVAAEGGRLEVGPRPGGGTRVAVRLPAGTRPADPAGVRPAATSRTGGPR
ncbi:sensor histidine kinase [Cellulosimicrobium protaetiae]|uniref:Oxygen sensor histidine kinase NreB n=1 Tax=Cellulosimicrobium protaetiae TaxID=2587808 RepID=A0A6M5UMV3_9MICO|nr:sensor histidine kinase [Cellulosimicrobium protaetiae]